MGAALDRTHNPGCLEGAGPRACPASRCPVPAAPVTKSGWARRVVYRPANRTAYGMYARPGSSLTGSPVTVTVTRCGLSLIVESSLAIVNVPVASPEGSRRGSMVSVTTAGKAPPAGVADSHGTSAVAVKAAQRASSGTWPTRICSGVRAARSTVSAVGVTARRADSGSGCGPASAASIGVPR